MRRTKKNMLMHGFILVTILATARSAEAEITMEAAFQGHCGHTSPCEQLCYEIHDGMYECDCIEGYELNKNGYSCQVINSTSDGHSKSDEDVLYQKGASFSAKLANDNERDNQLSSGYSSSSSAGGGGDGAFSSLSSASDEDQAYFGDDLDRLSQQEKENFNDYYISSESINFSNREQDSPSDSQEVPEFKAKATAAVNSNGGDGEQRIVNLNSAKPINLAMQRINLKKFNTKSMKISTTTTTTAKVEEDVTNTEAIMNDGNIEDDYYSKQDMSIYDDVNNNQLNLRPLSHNTYQNQNAKNSDSKSKSITNDNERRNGENGDVAATTNMVTATMNGGDRMKIIISENANISNVKALSSKGTIRYNESFCNANPNDYTFFNLIRSNSCNLECGVDGLCDNSEGSDSRCLCPFGKSGNNCVEDIKARVPKFSKKSWIAFPALRGAYKHVQIRIEFRPESFDGIILLSGERDDLTGDFMALLLNKGFLEFWFDCGSGVGSVRSRETILLNEWNSVIIYRHRWDAWLVLNHGTKVQGRSNGLFSRITFREPVFLGGTGNITGLAKRLPVFNGFVGCIRRFVANEHEYKFEEHPLGDVTKGFDIQDCVTDKCFKYPCQHGGKCLPSDQGAVCLCPIGFVGDLCEIRMDLQVPAFNGSSFLRYAPLGDSALIWLELKVILKPEHLDGLILYSGAEQHGDFIALSLNSGFVEFTFDLGSGPAVVRSEHPLSVGQWHSIKVSRTARLAVLKVDQSPEVMTISSNGFWHLSLPANLFLGGVNHVDKLPLDLKYKPFFVGCIQRIDINGYSLSIISEALGGTNIGNCPHACVARPCGPLAECVPQMESYECRCSPFTAQCNKAAEVPMEELQMNKAKNKSKTIVSKEHSNAHAKKKQPTKMHKEHMERAIYHLHKIPQPMLPPIRSVKATTTTSTTTTKRPTTTTTTSAPKTTLTAIAHNEQEEEEDFEDDIIFRDVHGMHKKFGHNEQAQQRSNNNNAKTQRNPQNNNNKRKHISKYQGKGQQQYYGGTKQPYHSKHTPIERKLSRLPTHYESFQTNPDSDILTFDDNIENDPNFRDNTEDHFDEHMDEEDEKTQSETEPFVMDESSLFDENDGTEEYHRKQLAEDMQRIMANTPNGHTTSSSKRPKLVLSAIEYDENDDDEYSDEHDDDLLEPVQSSKESSEIDVEVEAAQTTTPQTHTDWSLLKKLDLSADHQSHIGVRKNFGACFAGEDSYFHYNDAETMSQIISYNIDLNLRIKTHSRNGVILWTGRQGTTEDDDDYLSLGIDNGYLHFRYDLGSGEVDIRFNMTKVSDGLWHRVRAIRDSQEGFLEVDGRKSPTQRSPGKLRQLNTDTGLYVGGMPDVSYFTRRKYASGIVGCISEIVLAGELKLNFDPNTLGTAHNVETGIL